MRHSEKRDIAKYKKLVIIIVILWIIILLSFIFPLKRFGIIPRTLFGLIGIATSPFLHQGFAHLIANTISLLILGSIFIGVVTRRSGLIIFYIFLGSGLGTWLIGRPNSIHIGASGIIYGLIGYLVSTGFFRRDFKTIIVSIIVFILYGGALLGVLPSSSYISWESHLSGFITGVICARKFS